jgi:SAM-dependent methyltransferase
MTGRRSRTAKGWNPLGLSIRDYARGDRGAAVIVLRGDGVAYPMPARLLFRPPQRFSALERAALRHCRGRVLDIGAGAGCHTLALQRRGLDVTAVDASPEAVRVMKSRGVRRCRVGNGLELPGAPYDTVLLLMNGIAIVKSIAGLHRFLRRCQRGIAPGGQILFDSMDLRLDDLSRNAPGRTRRSGRYFGEMSFRLRYRNRTGPRFQLLFIDFARLAREAERAGWRAQILFDEGEGRYLARLRRAQNGTPMPLKRAAAAARRRA